MVITTHKSILYAQNINGKDSKNTTMENYQTTKKGHERKTEAKNLQKNQKTNYKIV
jgi:hypothetical protein